MMTDSAPKPPPASPTLRRRLLHAALFCLPVACWVAAIALASTNIASQAHTNIWLWRVVHLFSPGTLDGDSSSSHFGALSWAVRKMAHLAEYAVLGFLSAGALKALFPGYVDGNNRRTLGSMALVVIPFGTLVASVDELHQTTLPSRTGSIRDVGVDMIGLAAGVLAMWMIRRRRDRKERNAMLPSP